jgi:hypothetical protein
MLAASEAFKVTALASGGLTRSVSPMLGAKNVAEIEIYDEKYE